jgi:hypothetical protein
MSINPGIKTMVEQNEFEDGTDDFNSVPENTEVEQHTVGTSNTTELTPDDFSNKTYVKIPENGELILTVVKVVENKVISGKNKVTGESFNIGLLKKDKSLRRIDIECEEGTLTIGAWEIFFKLLGKDGVLTQYGKEHKTFKGAKIKFKRNFNGFYANMASDILAKILSTPEKQYSIKDADEYKAKVAQAQKDKKLYSIELVK